jgi:aspartyl-tRNA(Asn)/glutamyl-tRNA(Gln) amidotransferase subunit A
VFEEISAAAEPAQQTTPPLQWLALVVNHPFSIAELAPRVRRNEISPVQIVEECLSRIAKLNPVLNAFITVTGPSALAEARAAEAEIQRGRWRGPLHGLPVSLKDLIDAAGIRTTAASAIGNHRVPGEDAEVVRRLRQAGAVILGKNNLHEFAYGGSSLISNFGEARNPWDVTRITGGSSGGSAAAVVAAMSCVSIGTDTAGSIREPGALCGCVGLKPTYGRVPIRGVIPLATSLDHVGPIAMSVADSAIVLQAIAGYDAADITSADVPVPDYVSAAQGDVKSLRAGVPRAYFYEQLDPEVAAAMEHALAGIKTMVASLREVSLDVPTDRTLQMAEAYAYHAQNLSQHAAQYDPETVRRIRTGEAISAAEYIRSRRQLEEARRDIGKVFAEVDVLVTPTTPMPAPRIDDLRTNPDALRPAELTLLRHTRPFNVWGLPAISVPCGFTQSGLPIGLQIAGPMWREDLVLRLAHAYERATTWHKRRPQSIA